MGCCPRKEVNWVSAAHLPRYLPQVVEKEKELDEAAMERMRQEIEAEMKSNLASEDMDDDEVQRVRSPTVSPVLLPGASRSSGGHPIGWAA